VLSLKIYASYARTSPSISLHGRGDQIRIRVLLDEFLAPLPSKYSNAKLAVLYVAAITDQTAPGGERGGVAWGEGELESWRREGHPSGSDSRP